MPSRASLPRHTSRSPSCAPSSLHSSSSSSSAHSHPAAHNTQHRHVNPPLPRAASEVTVEAAMNTPRLLLLPLTLTLTLESNDILRARSAAFVRHLSLRLQRTRQANGRARALSLSLPSSLRSIGSHGIIFHLSRAFCTVRMGSEREREREAASPVVRIVSQLPHLLLSTELLPLMQDKLPAVADIALCLVCCSLSQTHPGRPSAGAPFCASSSALSSWLLRTTSAGCRCVCWAASVRSGGTRHARHLVAQRWPPGGRRAEGRRQRGWRRSTQMMRKKTAISISLSLSLHLHARPHCTV